VEKANTLLGYSYFMTGSIVEGKQIGRQIGFPTANLSLPKQKLLPTCGVYAVGVEMTNGTRKSGMLCIGHRPTVEANGELSIEVHIFDFDGNLYGKEIRLEFIGRLREERRFSSLEELQLQLRRDAADAQALTDKMP
jgi:riboflavin kinase/FMN adenylyltransferase